MPEGSLRECRGEWGFPSLQPQTHFSKWSLYLPLLSQASRAGVGLARPGFPDAWLWLQFRGCLVHRAQLMSLLDLGAPGSMGFKAGAHWVCLVYLTPWGLRVFVSWVPVSESVSSPQFALSLCSLKWGNADRSASPRYPLRSPFPTFFPCSGAVLERAEEGVFHPLCSGLALVWWTLLTPTPNSQFLLPQFGHLPGLRVF